MLLTVWEVGWAAGQREELSSKDLHLFHLRKPRAPGVLPKTQAAGLPQFPPLSHPIIWSCQVLPAARPAPATAVVLSSRWLMSAFKRKEKDKRPQRRLSWSELREVQMVRPEVEVAFHSLGEISCSCYQGGSNGKMGEGGSSLCHGLTSPGMGHHMSHPCSKCHAVLWHLPGASWALRGRGGGHGMAQGHLPVAPPGAELIIPPCLCILYKEWESWACYRPGQGSYTPSRRGLEESIYRAWQIRALRAALHLLCDLPESFSPGLPAAGWAVFYERELSFFSWRW